MGLKVYGMNQSTNTLRVIAALNELGLEYEMVTVDFRTGAHKQPSFLALNPFGQMPVLEDGDLVLHESRAINKYLVRKYKPELLRCGGSAAEAALVDVWLEVEAQQFDPPTSDLVFEAVIKPMLGRATDPAVVEAQAAKLAKVLDVYEARLAQSKYLAGDKFTVADLNHLPYTHFLMLTPKKDVVTSRPHVLAWWNDVSSRPAWVKTVQGISK